MFRTNWIGMLLCVGLTACGGGGGGGASGPVQTDSSPPGSAGITQERTVLNLDTCKKKQVGQSCGDNITLWSKDEAGQHLIIKVDNPSNQIKNIQLKGVFANDARALISTLPNYSQNQSSLVSPVSNIQFRQLEASPTKVDVLNTEIQKQNQLVDTTIKHTVEAYHVERRHRRSVLFSYKPEKSPTLYSNRNWQVIQGTGQAIVQTQLQGQAWLANERSVNVWVADSVRSSYMQDMKITPDQAQKLAQDFADLIYPYVTNLIGEPWGGEVPLSLVSSMLAPQAHNINIVLQDITPDNQPLGMVGYFASQNNFLKSKIPDSNEALVFFVDAPTYGKLDAGNQAMYAPMTMTTLAHELQHMIQFYQKRIRHEMTAPPMVWQNETASQAIAYLVDRKLYPDIQESPSLKRNGEFNQSLGYAGCVMNKWGGMGDTCSAADHYPKALSFSMYLLHQYGPVIMRDWVQNDQRGEAAILSALTKQNVHTTLPNLLKKWGISTQFSEVNPLDRIGFPANNQMLGYTLKAVLPENYPSYRGYIINHSDVQSLKSPYQFSVEHNFYASKEVSVPAGATMDLMVLVNP